MATETITRVTDDLDGTESAATITFAITGIQYEIDLSPKNYAKLQKALEPYIEAGRRVGGRTQRGTASKASSGASGLSKTDLAAVRTWAQANGHKVADRGRIAADVQEAWKAAGSPA